MYPFILVKTENLVEDESQVAYFFERLTRMLRKIHPFQAEILKQGLAIWLIPILCQAGPKPTPHFLRSHNISDSAYEELVKQGVVREYSDSTLLSCGLSDPRTIGEKILLSELTVLGEITGIEYLYKEGGPIKTVYTMKVASFLRGKGPSVLKIVSPYGPVRRDHRKWKRNTSRLEIEIGDKGVFILTDAITKKMLKQFPEHSELFAKTYSIYDDPKGIYLVNQKGEMDTVFQKKLHPKEAGLEMSDIDFMSKKINKIMKED